MIIRNKFFRGITIVMLVLTASVIKAQESPKEFISANIGLGYAFPQEAYLDIMGSGFYGSVEYVNVANKWFSFRPYLTYINAPFDQANSDPDLVASGYEISTNAVLLGAKVRLTIPIPYVAPFFEIGVGTSLGDFTKSTGESEDDIVKVSGITTHIPFSLGLAIGKRHRTEIALDYYFNSRAEQFNGAFAVGFVFPLDVFKSKPK